jgi:predicted nucleic acid-binding protein
LIFLDTNVMSETLRKTPNPAVIAWLVRNDEELALPPVTIAGLDAGQATAGLCRDAHFHLGDAVDQV